MEKRKGVSKLIVSILLLMILMIYIVTSIELYNAWQTDKIRYTIGIDKSIKKHHVIGLYYRYQNIINNDEDNSDCHILGINYKYKF